MRVLKNDYHSSYQTLAKFPRLLRCGSRACARLLSKEVTAGFSLVTLRLKETDLFIFRGTSSAAGLSSICIATVKEKRERERENLAARNRVDPRAATINFH